MTTIKSNSPGTRRFAWRTVGAGVLVAALAMAFGGPGNAQPRAVVGTAANPNLTTHLATEPGRPHQLVVVDTEQKAIAVYKIDPNSGAITFASMRSITWDLKMDEFNSKKLFTPKEIREGLDAAR